MEWHSIAALGAAMAIFACLTTVLWNPVRRRVQTAHNRRAVQSFRLQREKLEAKFFDIASAIGKPRGLRWLDCDWQHAVTFGRDRETGLLTAFVAVNISFEAIEGGDMEDVAAVSTVRDAAALFHYRNGTWGTGGRALFNMSPGEALAKLENQYEPVRIGGEAGARVNQS
ncbi:MAG: hypothetical protein WD069_20965 [Planctomycetales bacterium]